MVSASVTFNIFFYLFCIYLYITRITIKEPKQKGRHGTASNKITGGGGGGLELVCGRPNVALGLAFLHQTKQLETAKTIRIKRKQKAKRAAGTEGQVDTMLNSHTRQIDTIDKTALKRAKRKKKELPRGGKTEVPPWDGKR